MLSFNQYKTSLQESTHYRVGKNGFDAIRNQFLNNSHVNTLLNVLQPYASKLHLKIIDNKITNNIHFSIVDDFQSIKRMYDSISHIGVEHIIEDKNSIKFRTGDVNFTFYKSGGGFKRIIDEDGNELVNNKPSSYQHEEAIVYILNAFPEYPTKTQINKNIGFEFDDTWFLSFKETYNAIGRVIDIQSYEFYRDSDKNKLQILSLMTQSKYLPDSKDNWNPSDVWAINKHNKQNVIDTISETLYRIETGRADVYDLNDTIKHLFDTRQLIGFSLKKVVAPPSNLVSESVLNEFAKIEKVEVDYNYVDNVYFDKPLKMFKFNDTLSYIDMYCNMKEFGKDYSYMFRLAPRGKSNDLNVYCQGSGDYNKSSWDGSSSKALINKLTDFKIPEFKDYVDYQLNVESNVWKTLDVVDSRYSHFIDYVKHNRFIFIDCQMLETEQPENQYMIKRCLVLLHFLYCLEQTNMTESLKMLCLSSKKQNHFSSVFYKIS
jgi:hypothetical protein